MTNDELLDWYAQADREAGLPELVEEHGVWDVSTPETTEMGGLISITYTWNTGGKNFSKKVVY